MVFHYNESLTDYLTYIQSRYKKYKKYIYLQKEISYFDVNPSEHSNSVNYKTLFTFYNTLQLSSLQKQNNILST